MQKCQTLLLVLMVCFLGSCDLDGTTKKVTDQPNKEISTSNENSNVAVVSQQETGRDSWQKPGVILSKMGDLKDKTVADIAAGFGYFTFLLASKRAKVLVIEIDQEMIDFIGNIASDQSNPIYKENIEYRLVKPNDPMLEKDELDHALMVNIIGYLEDKPGYLRLLRKGLRSNGQITIVDFKMKRLPPNLQTPKDVRVYPDIVEEILYAAGYENIQVDDTSLEYQYIITATNPKI